MTGLIRMVGIGLAAAMAWTAAAAQVARESRLPLEQIVPGATVTQPFGCTTLAIEPFDPFCPGRHVHTGIDLAAPLGSPVRSATIGFVHTGFDSSGCGLFVAITVDSRVRLLYCHLLRADVRSGDDVVPGRQIGELGESGLATGPHVHFEVQVDGRSVDPGAWLAGAS